MTREIGIEALPMAWFKRNPSKQAGLILHSDRVRQYVSHDFREALKEYGITSSMSRRGNCWDNACSETLFGSLKVERLHGRRLTTRRQAIDKTTVWLLWYNTPVCTRRWPMSARSSSSRTGLRLSQYQPTRGLGYGVRIPGARSI